MYYEGDGAIITSKCIITVLLSLLGDNTVGGERVSFCIQSIGSSPSSFCGLWCFLNTNTPQRKETHFTERGQSLHQFPTHGWQVMLAWWRQSGGQERLMY